MLRVATALAALVASLVAATAATAEGIDPQQLVKAGWTCFNDPASPRVVCSDPGHGRPRIPADPNGPPSYNFKVFGLDGRFMGTIHLIRADLYSGQPCAQTGGSYVFIAPIGYFRCEHL